MRAAEVHLADVRIAGVAMLFGAAALPALPGGDGLPCPLRALTGVPCPLCGMTTSVIATVHLRVADALAANPAGVAAVLVALVLLAARRVDVVRVPGWAPATILGVMWLWQLNRFAIL